MLQGLRDYFPKWLFAFFLGLSALLIVGASLYIPFQGKAKGPVLARINKVKIRKGELDIFIANIKQQQAQSNPDFAMTPEVESELRMHFFQQLVYRAALKQTAYQNNYRMHPKNVLRLIRQIPAFQIEGQFSSKRFVDVLAAMGQTKSAFLKEIEDHQSMEQIQQAVTESAFILPKEIQQFVRFLNQTRSFSYLELKAKDFLKVVNDLSEEELRTYYETSLTDFRVPEKVSFDYIELSHKNVIKSAPVQDSKSQNALKDSLDESFKAAVAKLIKLNEAHPRSLKEIADALHVNIQSSQLITRAGGETDITKHPDVLSEAFSQKVLQGDNSKVLQLNSECVVLLRLKEHRPLHLPAFEKVAATVKEKLTLHKAQQAAQNYGKTLLKTMQQDATALPKGENGSMVWHKVDGSLQQLSEKASPLIVQHAIDLPCKGKASKVKGFTMPNGDYVIIRLDKVNYGKVSQLEANDYEVYKKEYKQLMGQLDYSQYVYSSSKHANINYTLAAGL